MHPDDRAEARRKVEEALTTRLPIECQWRVVWPDGTIRWLASRFQAFRDGPGKSLRLFGVNFDVTERKRTEAALNEQADLLQLSQDAIFVWRLGAGIESWNRGAERLYGFTAEETKGRITHELLKTSLPAARQAFEAELKREGHWEGELIHTAKDGRQLTVWVRMLFVRRNGVELVLETTRDVTDRKLAEAALKESESRFRQLADGSPSLIWVNSLDGCEFVNKAYLKFVGVSGQEDVRHFDWAQFVHPDDRAALLEAYFASVRQCSHFDAVFRLRRYDGVYRWMRSSGIPRLSSSWVSVGCIGSTSDITEIKEAQQRVQQLNDALRVRNAELDTERAWWRGVVEGIADEVWVCDDRGNVSLINLPDTTAMALDPFENRTIEEILTKLEIMYPDGRPRPPEESPLLRSLHTGEVLRGEEIMRNRASGKLRHRQYSCAPTRDAAGKVVGAVAIVRDITQKKEAEEALREADRRKDEFLAILSHELRNPLAPIRNSIYILNRAVPGSEQARRAHAVIERQVKHMGRLVSDLLDVSRISRGKIQLQKARIDYRGVVTGTVDDHGSIFSARGIKVYCRVPEGPVWVLGDVTRLSQALGNLLQNAAKFTDAGGVVSVTLQKEGGNAVARVRDTGVGIAPEMISRVFQPFTQADTTLDRSMGGLGIGLALVKGLIELHGGEVHASSDGLGKGTELTMRLPLAEEAARVSQSEIKLVRPPARRVLVIEDNIDSAESLKEALELDRHEVAVAFTGQDGLEKAHAFLPDVVLCDIGLPGMSGYEVARAFRADHQLHDVPLVALTGYALAEDQKKAADAGFDRHLAKPLDLGLLEQVLSELPRRAA